jgi:peptide/nickel transport system ATP-binding protein/oligopeptide transport system ATP-binding protein
MFESNHLLQIEGLKTHFYTFDGIAPAVNDVSFYMKKGETLGLVGESGCGKSVTALSIMRLIKDPPGRIVAGRVMLDGTNLLSLSLNQMRTIRGARISMIFQEPMTSLNPVFTVGNQIAEMYMLHQNLASKEAWERAIEILHQVQIPLPGKRVHEYPHQLSGGMRQRAMIAMALACSPEILIADEPTTALDVTIQAQILDLMMMLQKNFGAAILMITHDLGIIAETARRVVVMYAGRVVEESDTFTIFKQPIHPYTKGLLRSVPMIGRRAKYGRQRLEEIEGVVPSLVELPTGCSFHPRCPRAMPVCWEKPPEILTHKKGHQVRCWLAQNA